MGRAGAQGRRGRAEGSITHHGARILSKTSGYDGKLQAAIRAAWAAGMIRRGMATHTTILHDDWCNLLAGRGPCNCDPEIRFAPMVDDPESN